MKTKSIFLALTSVLLSTAYSVAAEPMATNGTNASFSCQGFMKRADGSWWAGPNTLPFDHGDKRNILIRNTGPITEHSKRYANIKLYDILEEHCGAGKKGL